MNPLYGFVGTKFVSVRKHLIFDTKCIKYFRPSCLGSPSHLFQITFYPVRLQLKCDGTTVTHGRGSVGETDEWRG